MVGDLTCSLGEEELSSSMISWTCCSISCVDSPSQLTVE